MAHNSYTVMQDRIYGSLGYKIPDTFESKDFKVGDSVIVVTKKGEPIMTGAVSDIKNASLFVDGGWYPDISYSFKRM
jgi:hypothetical protein